MEYGEIAHTLSLKIHEHTAFQQLLEMDRAAACHVLVKLVRQMTMDQLAYFDDTFVRQAVATRDPQYRERAIELYAYFKWSEGTMVGTFCGFVSPGNRAEMIVRNKA